MWIFYYGLFFALLTSYFVVSHIRRNRRDLGQAIDYVARSLSSPRHDTRLVEVELVHARPLSDHMVRDIAESRGHKFVERGYRHSNATMKFSARGNNRRKMSIDD